MDERTCLRVSILPVFYFLVLYNIILASFCPSGVWKECEGLLHSYGYFYFYFSGFILSTPASEPACIKSSRPMTHAVELPCRCGYSCVRLRKLPYLTKRLRDARTWRPSRDGSVQPETSVRGPTGRVYRLRTEKTGDPKIDSRHAGYSGVSFDEQRKPARRRLPPQM